MLLLSSILHLCSLKFVEDEDMWYGCTRFIGTVLNYIKFVLALVKVIPNHISIMLILPPTNKSSFQLFTLPTFIIIHSLNLFYLIQLFLISSAL